MCQREETKRCLNILFEKYFFHLHKKCEWHFSSKRIAILRPSVKVKPGLFLLSKDNSKYEKYNLFFHRYVFNKYKKYKNKLINTTSQLRNLQVYR